MKNPLLRDMPRRCARNEVPKYMKLASELLQPRLFFQITRPNFIKARVYMISTRYYEEILIDVELSTRSKDCWTWQDCTREEIRWR